MNLSLSGRTALLSSRKPGHASSCLSLSLFQGAPGDLAVAHCTCWAWLARSLPPSLAQQLCPQTLWWQSWVGHPRVLFNRVLGFHCRLTAEKPLGGGSGDLDLSSMNCFCPHSSLLGALFPHLLRNGTTIPFCPQIAGAGRCRDWLTEKAEATTGPRCRTSGGWLFTC